MEYKEMTLCSDCKEIFIKCEICGKPYDQKETIRVFGDMNWAHKYCSAQCYTKWVESLRNDG